MDVEVGRKTDEKFDEYQERPDGAWRTPKSTKGDLYDMSG